jgi:hypothetical protein
MSTANSERANNIYCKLRSFTGALLAFSLAINLERSDYHSNMSAANMRAMSVAKRSDNMSATNMERSNNERSE